MEIMEDGYPNTVMELMRKIHKVLVDEDPANDIAIHAFIGMLALASQDSDMNVEQFCKSVHRSLLVMSKQMAEPRHTIQ